MTEGETRFLVLVLGASSGGHGLQMVGLLM